MSRLHNQREYDDNRHKRERDEEYHKMDHVDDRHKRKHNEEHHKKEHNDDRLKRKHDKKLRKTSFLILLKLLLKKSITIFP